MIKRSLIGLLSAAMIAGSLGGMPVTAYAAEDFGEEEIFAEEEFTEQRLPHGRIEVMGTPRRLVLSVKSVAETQDDLSEEYKGPAWKSSFDGSGNPTRAAMGFAKSKGLAVEDLVKKSINGVDYAFAIISHKGGPARELLPEMMKRIITRIVFPKNMYWVEPNIRFARPIRWLLCLFGSDVVEFELNGMKSSLSIEPLD